MTSGDGGMACPGPRAFPPPLLHCDVANVEAGFADDATTAPVSVVARKLGELLANGGGGGEGEGLGFGGGGEGGKGTGGGGERCGGGGGGGGGGGDSKGGSDGGGLADGVRLSNASISLPTFSFSSGTTCAWNCE